MKEQWNRMKSSKSFFCLLSILFLVLVASVMSPSFRTLDNFATIIRQSSTLIVLSTGLTAVLLTGGIDLSVGSTAAFAGCLCAQLLKMGVPAGLIFPVGLGVGLVIGLLNGFLVAVIKLPPFIATYATNWVLKGLSIIVMSGAVIYDLPAGFTVFGTGYVGKIPIIVIFALVIVAAVYFFCRNHSGQGYLCLWLQQRGGQIFRGQYRQERVYGFWTLLHDGGCRRAANDSQA